MKNQKKIMLIIGLTGLAGAGKGVASEVLINKGFQKFRIGDAVIAKMKEQGLEVDNASLRKFATDARVKYGRDIAIRWTWENMKGEKGPFLVDGIKSPEEIDFMKSIGDFHLICVFANPKIRFSRLTSRAREDDFKTREEFEERDRIERGWGMGDCIARADCMIINEGTSEELKAKVEKVVSGIIEQRASSNVCG